MRHDLRYALRMIKKNPGISCIIVFTLALGVSANTATFSVVNSILLRPMPVQNPHQIVVIAEQHKGNTDLVDFSYPDFVDFRHQADALHDVAAYQLSMVGFNSDGQAGRAMVNYVTGNFFTMLGVKSHIGRVISPGEGERLGADPVVVLGYSYWKKRFNSDAGVLNKAIIANGHALTVIGIASPEFHGPSQLIEPDAYLPISMAVIGNDASRFWTDRDVRHLKVLGRLKPNATLKTAEADLGLIGQRLAQQYPATNGDLKVVVIPERRARPVPNQSNVLSAISSLFLALAGLVLLVACVNVANILLARSIQRRHELAIRTALGAKKTQLVRQALLESTILAMLGGAAGMVLGNWASSLLESIRAHIDFPLRLDFSTDWHVFIYSFGLALLTGVVVGIVPAIRATRANVSEVLHEGGKGGAAGFRTQKLRSILVVGQIASSLVLLIIAGLFLRSLAGAQKMNLGFDSSNILNISMDPRQIGYDQQKGQSFYNELLSRVRSLPGVQSASLSFSVPFGYIHESAGVTVAGRAVEAGKQQPEIYYNTVDPGYFENLRIRLVAGRPFTDADNQNASPVAIINEKMARQLWPSENPIGKSLLLADGKGSHLQVIGIAQDGNYLDPTDELAPYFFVPEAQSYTSVRTLEVRTLVPPETMLSQVQQTIHSLAPDLPTFDVRTMKEALNGLNGFFIFRFGAGLAGALGFLGAILAIVGVYGVVSYSVGQRTRAIGIRLALGAQKSHILKMIIKQGSILVAAGIVTGLLLAYMISTAIKSLLIGVGAGDPLTFVATSFVLACVTLIACILPARRALRIDPLIALRSE